MKVVIDTNGYTAMLQDKPAVISYLEMVDQIFLPIFVVAELHYGFLMGSKFKQNQQDLADFLNLPFVDILQTTHQTAQIFGETKKKLRLEGTPIPTNDLWIASQTIEQGAILLTFDKHFKLVPGLRLWPG